MFIGGVILMIVGMFVAFNTMPTAGAAPTVVGLGMFVAGVLTLGDSLSRR